MRFCDDFVVGFQYRQDAEQFKEMLVERFRKFNLELHADKTRLIEFGRFAEQNRRRRGLGKPKTFDFLGLRTYAVEPGKGSSLSCGTPRRGSKKKLAELGKELQSRLHMPIPLVGKWLGSVLHGHYRYFGVPGNGRKLGELQVSSKSTMVQSTSSPQSAFKADVGTYEPPDRTVFAKSPNYASLSRFATVRHNPRQEPSALAALAGICAGGAG